MSHLMPMSHIAMKRASSPAAQAAIAPYMVMAYIVMAAKAASRRAIDRSAHTGAELRHSPISHTELWPMAYAVMAALSCGRP